MIPRPDIGPIDWAGLAALLAVGTAVYIAILIVGTAWRLVRPPRRTYAWAVARGRPGDPREACDAAFTEDGHAWCVEGLDAAGPTVIVTHGWGSSRIEMLDRLDVMRRHAARVVLWDMPGHGDAPGLCTLGDAEPGLLAGMIDDAGPGPVVLYGWSLGAEVSLLAAALRPGRVAGLILEGAYLRGVTPARRMLARLAAPSAVNLGPGLALIGLVFGGRPGRRWRRLDRTRLAAGTATLLVHAERDVICPLDEARVLAAALAGAALVTISGAGHDDVWREGPGRARAEAAVAGLLQRCRAGAGG